MALRDTCKIGHPLTGNNVLWVKRPGGNHSRTCRMCRHQYERQLRAEARGKQPPTPRRRVGVSLTEKIIDRSVVRGDCRVWTGPVSYGMPQLRHEGVLLSVRPHLYERKNGAVPWSTIVKTTCGNDLCIAEAHWALGSRNARAILARTGPENVAKARASQIARQQQSAMRQNAATALMAHLPRLVKWIQTQWYSAPDPENVAMDALMAAYELSTNQDPPKDMWAFLMRSARNRLIDDHRHDRVTRICDVGDDVYISVSADLETTNPSVLCETQEQVECETRTVRQLLRRVREKEPSGYQVLLLQLDGHSLADIGKRLSLKSRTVERRLQAVRDLILPAERSRRIF